MARVLLVDDHAMVRESVTDLLEIEGHEVCEAPNGEVALRVASEKDPDVILLDIDMPVMDGREFARRYRERPGVHVPIILFSAHDLADIQRLALEIGADAVCPKPFELVTLMDDIERLGARGATMKQEALLGVG